MKCTKLGEEQYIFYNCSGYHTDGLSRLLKEKVRVVATVLSGILPFDSAIANGKELLQKT
jgi:hypothetical protein